MNNVAKIEQSSVFGKVFTEKITVKFKIFFAMSDNQTIKDRLKAFIKSLGIGQGAFEKAVGFSNGYVNNIRKSIQPEKLQSIVRVYPQLNPGWLMTGEGEMLREEPGNSVDSSRDISLLKNLLQANEELLQANEELLQAKEELLQTKEVLLKEREVRLKEKDEMIGLLREKIEGLESFIGEKSVPVASSTRNATGIPVQGLSTRSGL